MEAGHKKERYFWKLLRVCDEWRGSTRIGCWRKEKKGGGLKKKCRKRRRYVDNYGKESSMK